MGCKKGKSCEEIGQFVLETLEQEQISIQAVTALATIDLKKEEPGFLEFVKNMGVDFLTYPKEVLKEVPGPSAVRHLCHRQSAWTMCVNAQRLQHAGKKIKRK